MKLEQMIALENRSKSQEQMAETENEKAVKADMRQARLALTSLERSLNKNISEKKKLREDLKAEKAKNEKLMEKLCDSQTEGGQIKKLQNELIVEKQKNKELLQKRTCSSDKNDQERWLNNLLSISFQ